MATLVYKETSERNAQHNREYIQHKPPRKVDPYDLIIEGIMNVMKRDILGISHAPVFFDDRWKRTVDPFDDAIEFLFSDWFYELTGLNPQDVFWSYIEILSKKRKWTQVDAIWDAVERVREDVEAFNRRERRMQKNRVMLMTEASIVVNLSVPTLRNYRENMSKLPRYKGMIRRRGCIDMSALVDYLSNRAAIKKGVKLPPWDG